MADRDYRVALDIYSGPLDLLLYLIKETEVDIYDIPISHITEQYILYVEALKMIDLNLAGDFLIMASRLMEIKAKTLAPEVTLEEEAEEEDPRLELVRQLIEYKKFKEAARDLEDLARERALRFGRPAERHDEENKEAEEEKNLLGEASVWALVNAFTRLMRETGGPLETTIVYDDLPVENYMDRIMAIVTEKRGVAFFDLFTDRKNKLAIIGTFLALLELVRMRKIKAQQAVPFGEIQIILREDAPTDEPLPGRPITEGLAGSEPAQEEQPPEGQTEEQSVSEHPSEPEPAPGESARQEPEHPEKPDEEPQGETE
ncbi:MAG: segregation/condensation protein A [Planctomycetes bacterium]|nr:segregation/condensation protein A [Planctomycetota bacterium]